MLLTAIAQTLMTTSRKAMNRLHLAAIEKLWDAMCAMMAGPPWRASPLIMAAITGISAVAGISAVLATVLGALCPQQAAMMSLSIFQRTKAFLWQWMQPSTFWLALLLLSNPATTVACWSRLQTMPLLFAIELCLCTTLIFLMLSAMATTYSRTCERDQTTQDTRPVLKERNKQKKKKKQRTGPDPDYTLAKK